MSSCTCIGIIPPYLMITCIRYALINPKRDQSEFNSVKANIKYVKKEECSILSTEGTATTKRYAFRINLFTCEKNKNKSRSHLKNKTVEMSMKLINS